MRIPPCAVAADCTSGIFTSLDSCGGMVRACSPSGLAAASVICRVTFTGCADTFAMATKPETFCSRLHQRPSTALVWVAACPGAAFCSRDPRRSRCDSGDIAGICPGGRGEDGAVGTRRASVGVLSRPSTHHGVGRANHHSHLRAAAQDQGGKTIMQGRSRRDGDPLIAPMKPVYARWSHRFLWPAWQGRGVPPPW